MTEFKDLNLDPKILKSLEDKGYTTPTSIQLQAIPAILEGKDLLGIAQTGTGKTAAFCLPILNNLIKSGKRAKFGCIRTLILTPTRELAQQIADNVEIYSQNSNLRYGVIFGGVNDKKQIAQIEKGVDLLIATPGRLIDLTNQGHIKYMQLEYLVLDEADRMLDMGFINDIKQIITKLPPKRQNLLFSATMPKAIEELANEILQDPAKVEVAAQSSVKKDIEQKIFLVSKYDKEKLLKAVLGQDVVKNLIVFARTKHGADRIANYLQSKNISSAAIHGNRDQDQRQKALDDFKDGKIRVLVATDIAARGIDVPGVSHVINFEIPTDPESYVHRIGRTARGGMDGMAISFCDPSYEMEALEAIEKTINQKIEIDDSHPFHKFGGDKKESRDQKSSRSDNNNRKSLGNKNNKDFDRNKNSKKNYKKKKSLLKSILSIFGLGFLFKKSQKKDFRKKKYHNSNHKSRRPNYNKNNKRRNNNSFKGKQNNNRRR